MPVTAEIEVEIANTRERGRREWKRREGILVGLLSHLCESKRRHVGYSFSKSKDCFFRKPKSPRGKVMECNLRSISE